jgi:hypothetical protein
MHMYAYVHDERPEPEQCWKTHAWNDPQRMILKKRSSKNNASYLCMSVSCKKELLIALSPGLHVRIFNVQFCKPARAHT